ncbi:MAG: DUF192 domain-containing protein [Actinomycetota bacterium]|nr:DUF192 domain-containing protein [Actinomycetota bacterium]
MTVTIAVADRGDVIATEAVIAQSFLQRARGLLGRPPLTSGEALILPHARQVHTIGMRYPIDVVFCDEDWTVIKVIAGLRPTRVSGWVRRARWAVELRAGMSDVQEGDRLEVTGP